MAWLGHALVKYQGGVECILWPIACPSLSYQDLPHSMPGCACDAFAFVAGAAIADMIVMK